MTSVICDKLSDCENGGDEFQCRGKFHDFQSRRTKNELTEKFKCSYEKGATSYNWFETCIYDHDYPVCEADSMDSASLHLFYCEHFQCPSYYKCPDSYCVPVRHLCDGIRNCPYGEDEALCGEEKTCAGLFRCLGEDLCLALVDICDNRCHCKLTCDDERLCDEPFCPGKCFCIGYLIHCTGNTLLEIPIIHKAMNSSAPNLF